MSRTTRIVAVEVPPSFIHLLLSFLFPLLRSVTLLGGEQWGHMISFFSLLGKGGFPQAFVECIPHDLSWNHGCWTPEFWLGVGACLLTLTIFLLCQRMLDSRNFCYHHLSAIFTMVVDPCHENTPMCLKYERDHWGLEPENGL